MWNEMKSTLQRLDFIWLYYVDLEKVKLTTHGFKDKELPEVWSEKKGGTSKAQGIFLR